MEPTGFRDVRIRLGMSQKALSDALGFSAQQISNYETGRTPIPKTVEMALAHLCAGRAGGREGVDRLSSVERETVRKFCGSLRENLGRQIVLIVAFGSKVRGDSDDESDLDMLIVVKTYSPKIRRRIFSLLFDIDPSNSCNISPVVYSLKDFQMNENFGSPFISGVKEEGVFL